MKKGEKMLKTKYNTNYIKNSRLTKKYLDSLVDAILHERKNKQPHDFISKHLGNKYARTNHYVLGIPGKFKRREGKVRYTESGKEVFPDGVETITPDGENIPEEVVGIIEYLTSKLNEKKVQSLYYTTTSVVNQLHKNYIIFVVTNYNEVEPQKVYQFGSMTVVVNFIFFDEKKIYKILNTLRKKDYNKEEMSELEVVSFLQAISFVKDPYAKDFIEKSVELFISIEKIKPKHQIDLFIALKLMIRHYFEGDEKKLRRLLKMIIKALPEPTDETITELEYPYCDIAYLGELLSKRDEEISDLKKIIEKLKNEKK